MHNVTLALQGSWKVLVTSLVLGAGLPLIFALGIRSVAWGAGGEASASGTVAVKANPAGTVLAWVLFLIVLAGIVLGVTWVVATGFGKVMSFDHIYPTIHSK
jgi:ACR3 family arsenite efflux pump ArsB